MSIKDVVLIARGRFRSVHFVLIQDHIERLYPICTSIPELLNRLNEVLDRSILQRPTNLTHQILIDNRFKTIVEAELRKGFSAEELTLAGPDTVENLIEQGATLKEIKIKVREAITANRIRSNKSF